MKALGIIAIVVASIAVVIPVIGATWLPIIAGVMAVIAVRAEHILAFVALGINIVNVAFLSASLKFVDNLCEGNSAVNNALDAYNAYSGDSLSTGVDCSGGVFWTYMGINLALAALAVGLHFMNKKA